MNTTDTKFDHARQQAHAQAESIVELVAALERDTAAAAFVKNLTGNEVFRLCEENELDADATNEDAARETLLDAIQNNYSIEPDGFTFDEDEARQNIQDDALEVQVRADWYNPGDEPEQPSEFKILLCTGGPAVRIVGELNQYLEPCRAWLECQDWGTGWEEVHDAPVETETLLTYCRQFYFGEA